VKCVWSGCVIGGRKNMKILFWNGYCCCVVCVSILSEHQFQRRSTHTHNTRTHTTHPTKRHDEPNTRKTPLAYQMVVLLQRPVMSLLVQPPLTPVNPRAMLRAKKSWRHKFVVWHLIVLLAVVFVAIALYVRHFTDLGSSLRN